MRDPDFRAGQERDRYAEHVRPINELVDELRGRDGRGWLPYATPWHGGIRARVLSVLRDPGTKTQDGVGSGFLCIENDDATAQRQCEASAQAAIAPGEVTPWNAYPWYINRKPTAAELIAGVDPLARLVQILPRLRVVLLQGREAQDTWRRLHRRYPTLVRREVEIVATYHPSQQALRSPDPEVRHARAAHRTDAYARVAAVLQTTQTTGTARTPRQATLLHPGVATTPFPRVATTASATAGVSDQLSVTAALRPIGGK